MIIGLKRNITHSLYNFFLGKLFSQGFFLCSIGSISEKNIRNYIEKNKDRQIPLSTKVSSFFCLIYMTKEDGLKYILDGIIEDDLKQPKDEITLDIKEKKHKAYIKNNETNNIKEVINDNYGDIIALIDSLKK